jgi:DinB superfamily
VAGPRLTLAPRGILCGMSHADDLRKLLVRDLEGFQREIALFPDDAALWRVVPGITNSAGNLALHVAGNLQYFVGTCVGRGTYVRNRPAEFSTRGGSRGEVDSALRAAIDAVNGTLTSCSDATLNEAMPGAPNGMLVRTGVFLLHLVAHTGFHLGQAGYLRRMLTGEHAVSAGPLPLDVLGQD